MLKLWVSVRSAIDRLFGIEEPKAFRLIENDENLFNRSPTFSLDFSDETKEAFAKFDEIVSIIRMQGLTSSDENSLKIIFAVALKTYQKISLYQGFLFTLNQREISRSGYDYYILEMRMDQFLKAQKDVHEIKENSMKFAKSFNKESASFRSEFHEAYYPSFKAAMESTRNILLGEPSEITIEECNEMISNILKILKEEASSEGSRSNALIERDFLRSQVSQIEYKDNLNKSFKSIPESLRIEKKVD